MNFATHMLDTLTNAYIRTDIRKLGKSEPPETNIGKLFYLAGWGFDILREQTEKVRLWDNIDKIQGAVLDSFGDNYGVARGTATNKIFGIIIRVKTLAMLASGNLDTLVLSTANPFGIKVENVRYEEVYPAKVYIYINEGGLDEEHKNVAGVIAELMNRIKSGGVGIKIFYRTYNAHRTTVYVGASACPATLINIPPTVINKKTEKQVKLKIGVGALLCMTAFCPASRQKEFKWQEQY